MASISAAFGQRLREVRQDHGVSQEDLARRTGMYANTIGRLERGAREPRISTVLRLARGLGVPPGVLLDPLMSTGRQGVPRRAANLS
jgi:transcriptional regulator with XRE-family HTH domain